MSLSDVLNGEDLHLGTQRVGCGVLQRLGEDVQHAASLQRQCGPRVRREERDGGGLFEEGGGDERVDLQRLPVRHQRAVRRQAPHQILERDLQVQRARIGRFG